MELQSEREQAKNSSSCVLFVFAHQDDELCYTAKIKRLALEGTRIEILWITDGALFVPAEVRRKESTKAMETLGISSSHLHFWNYPDSRSFEHAPQIVNRLTDFMGELEPSEVYTIAFEGGHPDHDTANFAVATAAKRQNQVPRLYEAPAYNAYKTPFLSFNKFIPAETETSYTPVSLSDQFLRIKVLLNYRSQFWMTVFPMLTVGWIRAFGPGEPYRPMPDWNYRQPPHEGKLSYERLTSKLMFDVHFSDFRNAVSSAL